LVHLWLDTTPFRYRTLTRPGRAVISVPARVKLALHQYSHNGTTLVEYKYALAEVSKVSRPIAKVMMQSTSIVSEPITCHSALRSFFSGCSKQIFPAAHFLPSRSWTTIEAFCAYFGVLPTDLRTSIATEAPQLFMMLPYYYSLRSNDDIMQVYSN
jgi:hypothetical protein